eukprot:TRINITY_DN30947_c0_g1_i2.p1 TRINITY_DN30947_c0_g1~~TRINITY_DN30947_c0_g1_i2.p1  ORF type:complete len:307 (+),score=102.25 TRINITY_DN30947_c0_g1_i2:27-947(+)
MRATKRPRLDPKAGWDWGKTFDLDECKAAFGWEESDWLIGVDEAGRGPALGSMVYGGFGCRVRDHARLVECGVDDSKALNDERRRAIRTSLLGVDEGMFLHECLDLTAEAISRQQLARAAVSLNKISHAAAIDVIKKLEAAIPEGEKVAALFVDIVGPQETYVRKLQAEFAGITIVVRSKADAIFPVTGAASIMAKVLRDELVETIPKQMPSGLRLHGTLGSGYPADPITQRWMDTNTHKLFVLPNIARFDWQPVKDIEESRCISVSWNQDASDLPEVFGGGTSETRKRKRWQFFQEMFLSRPEAF